MSIKKITTLALLLFCGLTLHSQAEAQDPNDRSELKVNGLYLILGGLEVDYEYLLNEESSLGISAAFIFTDETDYNWGITPHYRLFFGNEFAQGFFVEGNAILFNYDYYGFEDILNGGDFTMENKTSGGLGLAIGGKFRTKRNVVVEIVGGVGRIFDDNSIDTVYPRFGINIGKRF